MGTGRPAFLLWLARFPQFLLIVLSPLIHREADRVRAEGVPDLLGNICHAKKDEVHNDEKSSAASV